MKKESEIEKIYKKAFENRHLLYASLELTFKCNFACKFCYNPVEREGQKRKKKISFEGEYLTLEEIYRLLSDLRKAGVLYFTLTGGEPMVHPHFWEILEKAKEHAFLLRVFTNGSLIDEKAAEKLGKIFPNCIEISLYGASEECYEKSCGRGHLFPKVVKALQLLKREGVAVYLKCNLTKFTEVEMDKIQDLADAFGFPLNWDPILQMSDDGDDFPLMMNPSKEAIERLFKDKKFKTGSSPFEGEERKTLCNIGRNLIHIDPYGNIFPCIQYREPLGNVKKDDIEKIFKGAQRLFELMKVAEDMAKKMKEEKISCYHCIGKSKLLYGSECTIDPTLLYLSNLKKKYSKE